MGPVSIPALPPEGVPFRLPASAAPASNVVPIRPGVAAAPAAAAAPAGGFPVQAAAEIQGRVLQWKAQTGLTRDQMAQSIAELYGRSVEGLTKGKARKMVDMILAANGVQ